MSGFHYTAVMGQILVLTIKHMDAREALMRLGVNGKGLTVKDRLNP